MLRVFQVLSGIVIAFFGLPIPEIQRVAKRFPKLLWTIIITAILTLFITTVLIDEQSKKEKRYLIKTIEETKDAFFKERSKRVMEIGQGKEVPLLQSESDVLEIVHPLSDSTVHARQFIKGKVLDPEADVWVIIHPMETSAYWVQPIVSIEKDGRWSTYCYFGRAGDLDRGKYFQVLAVVEPKEQLEEGVILSKWPEAKWRSKVVSVQRE